MIAGPAAATAAHQKERPQAISPTAVANKSGPTAFSAALPWLRISATGEITPATLSAVSRESDLRQRPCSPYNIESTKNRFRGNLGVTDIFYDAAGNMTDIGFMPGTSQSFYEMDYDALNLQSAFWDYGSSEQPRVYRYLYGPGNYRIIVYDSASNTRHWKIRDQDGSILREHSVTGWGWYQGSGSPGEQWVFEKDFLNGPTGLVATRNSGGGRDFFFRDHLGSTRLILGGNGTLKAKRAFYPYGVEVNVLGFQDEPASKYTGHERDMHDLTDYMKGRTCAFPFMRFMSVDPVRDNWNLYSYVGNRPVNFVDPTGLADRRSQEDIEILEDPDIMSAVVEMLDLTNLDKPLPERQEAGTAIVKLRDGDFDTTDVVTDGDPSSVTVILYRNSNGEVVDAEGRPVEATMHTHPGTGRYTDNGRVRTTHGGAPSQADRRAAQVTGKPVYIVNERRSLIKVTTEGKRTSFSSVLTGRDFRDYLQRAETQRSGGTQ